MGGRMRTMENRHAIDEKILALNREEARRNRATPSLGTIGNTIGTAPDPQVWAEIPGYFALTKFDYPNEDNSGAVFNPSFGVPVKVFMNTETGEIKTFSGNIFET